MILFVQLEQVFFAPEKVLVDPTYHFDAHASHTFRGHQKLIQ